MSHQSHDMQQRIATCLACYQSCLDSATGHCLEKGGAHTDPRHLRLMLDCAEICRTSADFLIRGSEHLGLTCALCAQICERCATDCERFEDAHMQTCAETCRRCAAACQEMSGSPV